MCWLYLVVVLPVYVLRVWFSLIVWVVCNLAFRSFVVDLFADCLSCFLCSVFGFWCGIMIVFGWVLGFILLACCLVLFSCVFCDLLCGLFGY